MEVGTVSLDSFFLLHIAQKKKFLCAIIGDPLAQYVVGEGPGAIPGDSAFLSLADC